MEQDVSKLHILLSGRAAKKENRYLRIGVTHSDAEAVVQTLVKSLKVSFEAEMLTSLVTSHSFGVASQETSHVVHILKFNILHVQTRK